MRKRYGNVCKRYNHVRKCYSRLRKRYGDVRKRYSDVCKQYGDLSKSYGRLCKRYSCLCQRYGDLYKRYDEMRKLNIHLHHLIIAPRQNQRGVDKIKPLRSFSNGKYRSCSWHWLPCFFFGCFVFLKAMLRGDGNEVCRLLGIKDRFVLS